ncbi:cupin domain-containing protein [Nesterenkonia sandarakina]|uniref:Cupin domain-containing protein n=1 Tax=Nesterenkonia sandarakina TaxID=272918 RepID=A0A2T0YK98_9MICC|nr:cupin domain-containing protein [Nesterenkonia sandarakina]PRZ15622.1 Cupin domain-containing protein [Nesterenkonia sandarakina]
METTVQYTPAGDGVEIAAPDAVLTVKVSAETTHDQYEVFEVTAPRGPATPLHRTGWDKTYYALQGRMIVQVGDAGYDMGPGSSLAIPADAPHTFTVLTPSVTVLVISLTGAMGRFHTDLAATLPPGRALEDAAAELQAVLGRHPVSMEGQP